MPKETQKLSNSLQSTIKKKSKAAAPWSGAPSLSDSLPSAPALLDTTEQVPLCAYYANGTESTSENSALKKKLLNRSRAKFVTSLVSVPLASLRSPLQKQYRLTQSCSASLTETPGKLTGLYCGCRWCLVCSRIRTSKLIQGYMPAIEAMPEKWFLTLSRPNVKGKELKAEIKHYLKCASLINRFLREKTKFKTRKDGQHDRFSSLRKIECTYNEIADTYHPHFHFIFDNEEAATIFLHQWLARNPTAELDKGNQLKKADNNSVLELFKYFTKVVSKSKSKRQSGATSSDYRIHLTALDTMFCALRAVRTFQPCGVIKEVSEEIEPEQALESGRADIASWAWVVNDWINPETAQTLTGYLPSPGILDISNHIVYPPGLLPASEPAPATLPRFVDAATGELVAAEFSHVVVNQPGFARVYNLPETRTNNGPADYEKSTFPAVESAFSELPVFGPWPKRSPSVSLFEREALAEPRPVAACPPIDTQGRLFAEVSNRLTLAADRTKKATQYLSP